MSPIIAELLKYGAVGLFAAIVSVVFVYYYKETKKDNDKRDKKRDEQEKKDADERAELRKKVDGLHDQYTSDMQTIQEQRLLEARKVAEMAMAFHEKTVTALSANAQALGGVDGAIRELSREMRFGKK